MPTLNSNAELERLDVSMCVEFEIRNIYRATSWWEYSVADG